MKFIVVEQKHVDAWETPFDDLDEAIAFFKKVGAERSYLTHLSHMLPCHAELEAELAPQGISVAWDGLKVEI